MNVVMTAGRKFVEVQGTAEGDRRSPAKSSLRSSRSRRPGIAEIVVAQEQMVAVAPTPR